MDLKNWYLLCLLQLSKQAFWLSRWRGERSRTLDKWFSTCGTRTTSDTRSYFWWYAKHLTILFKSCSTSSKILVRNLIWEKEANRLNSVSLSNDTARHRIYGTFDNISDQVTTAVRASKYGFAMQLDESADVTNSNQLLFYVRTTENDGDKTELLINKEVLSTTKG